MSDGVSRLGLGCGVEEDNDNLTYDTVTVLYQSNAFREACRRGEAVEKVASTVYTNASKGPKATRRHSKNPL